MLLARRLIEAGTRVACISWAPDANATWDTHGQNFVKLRNELLPQLDRAVSSLVSDLAERGMLERTVVAVMGEFGRTPASTATLAATTGISATVCYWRAAVFAVAWSTVPATASGATEQQSSDAGGRGGDDLSLFGIANRSGITRSFAAAVPVGAVGRRDSGSALRCPSSMALAVGD